MDFVGETISVLLIGLPVILIALAFFLGWKGLGRWLVPLTILQILLLVAGIWLEDTQLMMLAVIPMAKELLKLASHVLIPILTIVLAARLVDMRNPDTQRVTWLRAIFSFVALVLLLGLLGIQVILGSIWDVATDGLTGAFFVFLAWFGAFAGAFLLVWHLPRWWKLAGLVFPVVIILALSNAQRLGTIDPDGGWGKLPHLFTESRARMIEQALQRYQAEHASYPPSLAALQPDYLVYLPNPYLVRGQGWCYEAGGDYYRLGTVYREYFSSPESVKVYAAAGSQPDTDLVCP